MIGIRGLSRSARPGAGRRAWRAGIVTGLAGVAFLALGVGSASAAPSASGNATLLSAATPAGLWQGSSGGGFDVVRPAALGPTY